MILTTHTHHMGNPGLLFDKSLHRIRLGACALLLTALRLAATSDSATDRPNVLFIAIDDLNDWMLEPGNPLKTPNIDRLAARGMTFRRAYCVSPACNPSRAALMTGRHTAKTGIYGNRSDWRRALPDAITLTQHFMAHTYRVEGAGKIYHHHSDSAYHDDASFERFFKLRKDAYPARKYNRLDHIGSINFDWGVMHVPESYHPDVVTTDWVIDSLQSDDVRPWFVAAGIFRPHSPQYAPARDFEPYPREQTVMPRVLADDLNDIPSGGKYLLDLKQIWEDIMTGEVEVPGSYREAVRAYQACVTFADRQVGRMLDVLEARGRLDSTIIVLWSDHGFHLGEKEHWEKFALWEKSTRVPLLVVAPGVTPAGSVCDHPVSLLDIYPTLIDLCGLSPRDDLDGVSLLPLPKDPNQEGRRPVVTTYLRGNHAVRSKHWRYIQYADGTNELYNHRNDPNEWTNLAGDPQYRAVIEKHRLWLPQHDAEAVTEMR